MPVRCPRCGAATQDSMLFCQACGAPLAPLDNEMVARQPRPGRESGRTRRSAEWTPAQASAGSPAPIPPHVGAMPAERLHFSAVLSIIMGLFGLLAGTAVLMSQQKAGPPPPALIGATVEATAPANTPVPTAPGALASSTVQPTGSVPATSTGQPTGTIPPSLAGSASATVTPNARQGNDTPLPTPVQSNVVANSMFALQVLPGWAVADSKEGSTLNEVTLDYPATAPNAVRINAARQAHPTSALQILSVVQGDLQQRYPDTDLCMDDTQGTVGDITGTVRGFCMTITPSGGDAMFARDVVWAGTSRDGLRAYTLSVVADLINDKFFDDALDEADTVQWIAP